jgi:GAF domain-containing protein
LPDRVQLLPHDARLDLPSNEPVDRAEATYTYLERHANRILVAGGLVVLNTAVLEAIRLVARPSIVHTFVSLALSITMFLLLFRLSARTVRFAVRSARHQSGLSRLMMQAVEQFAHEPAGVRGTIEALCASAQAAGCEVHVYDQRDRALWSPVQSTRIPLTAAMARRLLDAMRMRKPLLLTDVTVSGALPGELTQRDDTRALVVVPMWAGGDLVGVVVRRYASARQLRRSHEVALVSGFAALGAVAIGKALVVDREQQRAVDNALLLRSVHLSGEHEHEDHLASYALQAAEALGAPRAAIFARTSGQLRLVGSYGIPRPAALGARRIPASCPFVELVGSGEVVRHLQLDDLDTVAARSLLHLNFGRNVLAQPVHDARGFSGCIVLDAPRGGLVSRDHDLLTALARQVGMSLERKRMQRSIRKRSRHLACTPKLARSLTGQRDPGAVSRIATRELHEGFGFGRVSVALADTGGTLRIVASAGMLAQSSVPVTSTPVLDAAFESGRPYVSCAAESESEASHPRIEDPNAPGGCRSQLVVPIVGRDHRCVGVIAVYERDPESLGEDDLHMLETVADQLAGTLEQAELFETLERSYFKTVEALSAALEAKDAYTLDHARSITELSAAVGRRLGMRGDEIRDLKLGALLHDIGKIGVPGEILNKRGPLDDEEFEVMKSHTIIGEQIIAPIEFLEGVRPLVLHEHERWDGAGYPHGLRGSDIPLGARIIFVCDAWHAMTSDRPYRTALPNEEARTRLRHGAGSQFDPAVVDAFIKVLDNGEADVLPELTPA